MRTLLLLPFAAALASACAAPPSTASATAGAAGTLLLVGGGLDDDQRQVFERLLALAARHGPPRIVIATAASGDQDDMAIGKTAALQAWSPGVHCEVVRRETDTAATVAAIEAATAMFFTGGDQQRIVDRYRPGDTDTPEWAAMQRLLQRGGVIAGSSAGCAMMGDRMLLGGSSGDALGAAGPRTGPGMHFLPWAMTDSHFCERHRFGRLCAALEAAGMRLGIGVGEDGCVEVDLATGRLTGLATAEAVLVDVGAMRRDGAARRAVRARRIAAADQVDLPARLRAPAQPAPPRPRTPPTREPIAEEGQNRQLASWRLIVRAARGGLWQLPLEGHCLTAWPAGDGEVAVDIDVGVGAD